MVIDFKEYYKSMKVRGVFFALPIIVLLILILFSSNSAYSSNLVDVSWPNCKTNLIGTQYTYGIVGVTGGLDFKPNKCVGKEAGWMQYTATYENTGYPGRYYGIKYKNYPLNCTVNNYLCLAYNYGYNSSLYSIGYASSQNVHSKYWWLDVETDNSWTLNPLINRQVIKGSYYAIKNNVPFAVIGIYSDPPQWNYLTKNWQPKIDEWAGTGASNTYSAAVACLEPSFTGGPILISQYTINIDQNYICSSNYYKMFFVNNYL